MAMIALYADDSSDGKQEAWLAVGAIVGWPVELFEAGRAWETSLEKHGLSYFKAKECENLRGEFQFLSNRKFTLQEARERASTIRNDFIAIINTYRLDAFGLALNLRDFARVIAGNQSARDLFGPDPTVLIYRKLITTVIDDLVDDFGQHFIAFLFDGHSRYKTAENQYDKLREEDALCRRMMGSVGHGDDKEHTPLQMADLLAYEARKRAMFETPIRDAFVRLSPAWKLFALIQEREIVGGIERFHGKGPHGQ